MLLEEISILDKKFNEEKFYDFLNLEILSFYADDEKIPNVDIVQFVRTYHHGRFQKLTIRIAIEPLFRTEKNFIFDDGNILGFPNRGKSSRTYEEALNHILHSVLIEVQSEMFIQSAFKRTYERNIRNYPHNSMIGNRVIEEFKKYFEELIKGYRMEMMETPAEEITKLKEPEFDMETHINYGEKTLRLNRVNLKSLGKEATNKFVLPLDSSKEEDLKKFEHLTKQPFSFLEYNKARFSVSLIDKNGVITGDDYTNTVNAYIELASFHEKLKNKRTETKKRLKKLKKAVELLRNEIQALKDAFERKSKNFNNKKYLKFIASRTTSNIKKMRIAEDICVRRIEALEHNRLINEPINFFERASKLYLGETGKDIIKDIKTLNYSSEKTYFKAIGYLFFLLDFLNKNQNKDMSAPLLSFINNEKTNTIKYPRIFKVMTGHMFIHTKIFVKSFSMSLPEMRVEEN